MREHSTKTLNILKNLLFFDLICRFSLGGFFLRRQTVTLLFKPPQPLETQTDSFHPCCTLVFRNPLIPEPYEIRREIRSKLSERKGLRQDKHAVVSGKRQSQSDSQLPEKAFCLLCVRTARVSFFFTAVFFSFLLPSPIFQDRLSIIYLQYL